ncbi:sigma-70 family RNA polymerase sigma factor [Aquisphaera insulae]|uniref:sigma-70 family RNA polymerase sigma factor n=1 Tax=Aquisphaera insulae TaxID=2712864 RepID=UPI0013EAD57F|nr:sigma-70 family RNA polymerase sigma factor [Aquisphaera insulae]
MLQSDEVAETVAEVLRGNKEAYRKVIRKYSLGIRSYIAAQVHHLDDVDDLAQEVFLAAYRGLHEFRQGDDFGAWLRGIARNKVYQHFRKTTRRNRAMGRFKELVVRTTEKKLEVAVQGDGEDSIELLLQCISKLPDRMRHIVRAGLDGSKPTDLAENLNTTLGAVYSLHYRANQLLRECVRKAMK